MNKVAMLFLTIILVACSACAGGSMGTGVRKLGPKLPDFEEQATIPWLFRKEHACAIQWQGREYSIQVKTELGDSLIDDVACQECAFAIPIQAQQIYLISDWFQDQQKLQLRTEYIVTEKSRPGDLLTLPVSNEGTITFANPSWQNTQVIRIHLMRASGDEISLDLSRQGFTVCNKP